MNNIKPAVILISLGALFGCGSDDTQTKYSDDYITNPAPVDETEPTDPVEPEPTDPTDPEAPVEELVSNGGFDSWTTVEGVSTPDGWTTIDDGISITLNDVIYQSDESSAAFAVLTGTQSNTDFRQSVDVEAGKTYAFSASIYHTDGGVRARGFVADYIDYSDENLVNQWQDITYTYTATADASIDIGLRFYDISGTFVEGEIAYVDDITFVETQAEVVEPDPEPTPDPEVPVIEDPVYGDLLVNGDFEYWTDTQPDNWVVATGNVVSANTDIVNRSVSSAAVIVETAKKNITQTVSVIADTTYTFTTNVYHTGGTVRARIFIDGQWNNDYTDATLLNEWQSYAFNYTASEDKEIELGLRFYAVGTLDTTEVTYVDNATFIAEVDLGNYYDSALNLTGYELKTELFNIINDHNQQSYGDLWDFMSAHALDIYYENDDTIIDMYSENPTGTDSYNFTPVTDQCGNYSGESTCYNREHSFPKSWFDDGYPMYTDVHHIFATDGYVNSKRSNHPFGEVASASWTSLNGSQVGSGSATLGYTGTVFEPIDEFKGDFARAYFYMATRYEDVIAGWSANSDNADAVLDGSNDAVYEAWILSMLKAWHEADPVSQKEVDRNNAAYDYQGNRNPFVDHPEFVESIWAD